MYHILVIDQGTHASRAMLFDAAGEQAAQAEVTVGLQRIDQFRVEQDPEDILASIHQAIQALPPDLLSRASYCGICTQRSTSVAWNRNSGKALAPALSWQDTRCQSELGPLKPLASRIRQLTGLPLSPHYGAGKFRWLLQHSATVREAEAAGELVLGPLASYLAYQLLKQQPLLVDHSNAHRSLLMDIRQLDWSLELLDLFHISPALLPKCVPTCANHGKLERYGIPITTLCGDQSAAFYAEGVVGPQTACINLGTGAFILANTAAPPEHTELLCGLAASGENWHHYLLEGTVNGAGTAISWLQQNQADFDTSHMDEIMTTATNPPLFINSVGGLGSPWWFNPGSPRFVGDADAALPEKLTAVVESIVFLLQKNLECIQALQPITQLKISGGLSRSDTLCQKLADLSGLVVTRINTREGSARGCAWLAGGQPDWHNPPGERFQAREDPMLAERYRRFVGEISRIQQNNYT